MYTESTSTQMLRFELVVSTNDYRTLVSALRGDPTLQPRATLLSREITAQVDLHPQLKSFSISQLGRHQLPRPVHIKPGSSAHNSLTRALAREVASYPEQFALPTELRQQLNEIIESCPAIPLNTIHADLSDFELLDGNSLQHQKVVAIAPLARIAPTLLLEFDDQPTLVVSQTDLVDLEVITRAIRVMLASSATPTLRVKSNSVDSFCSFTTPCLPRGFSISFFAHWGSYDDLAPAWTDELITTVKTTGRPQQISLRFALDVPIHGSYGLTIFAMIEGTSERIWLGKPGIHDAKFFIEHDQLSTISNELEFSSRVAQSATSQIGKALYTPALMHEASRSLYQHCPQLSLGGSLAQVAQSTTDEAANVSELIARLAQTDQLELIEQIRTTYGIGEIVFASPEFSHAGAGGLAQVITGLPLELSKAGIPVTIITPLYRYSNGQRHRAAEDILTTGLLVGDERIVPTYVGSVSVALGPTRHLGTSFNKRPPSTVRCKVYRAQSGRIRVFLLSAQSVFDRLYQPVSSDEQLRRAIIFSRASLEIIKTEQFGVRPSAIISNDWMTACIPILLALDPLYQKTPWLAESKALHMIHNGGADYHGRLPLVVNNEDLWPMFNLAPEHYFGFKDPHRDDLINLTVAASRHARGGVITVSQPYAQQLVSPHAGGDGLEIVLGPRRQEVFGISNGIKREEIERYLQAHTGMDDSELCDISKLLDAKLLVRTQVQKHYGLQQSASAKLISFVGRLAEQKGLQLLSGYVRSGAHSVLEEILLRHHDVQILIAGPTTPGDLTAQDLRDCIRYLSKKFPGRIAGVFDYIAHSTALEIISASTLFLMPSRFEPGGISQLEALAVGTPVIGRGVGGIAATIENYDPQTGRGTGFLCYDYSADAFANTTHWALTTCSDADSYHSLVSQARLAQHSWSDRAPLFAAVLQRVILGPERISKLPFLANSIELSKMALPQ